jgi:phosphohistidine phosphatase SixA
MVVAGLGLLAAAPRALAQGQDELWRALASGDHVALMRHAEAPGVGDPPGFRLEDCATQRNLNEAGRRFSRQLGEEFRRRGVARARVLSSRWCRCLETARLLDLGPVEPGGLALDSFFENPENRARSTDALRRLLADLPRDGGASVLVTHQVNVTALTGVSPPSGGIVVLRLLPDGGYAVAGRLDPR